MSDSSKTKKEVCMRPYNNIIAGLVLMAALMAVNPFNVETRQAVVLFGWVEMS